MKKRLVGLLFIAVLICAVTFACADSWQQDANGWWYRFDNGSYPQNQWYKISNEWYYFNSSGYMATGWVKSGSWYYLKSSGALATGWFKDNGQWYYADKNGAMQTGWIKDSGLWYYLSPSGTMVTGWFTDNGRWYFADQSGVMRTGWLNYNGTWYYLNAGGAMVTGFSDINGHTYFFNESGAMQTGWVYINDAYYYFSPYGDMYKSTVAEIDGQTYYFAADGKWTEQLLSAAGYDVVAFVGDSIPVTVTFLAKGTLTYKIKDTNVVSCKWGTWSGYNVPLTFTAKAVGSTTVTVTNSVNSDTIEFTVTVINKEVNDIFGKTVAQANEILSDKLVYRGDGYYANGSFGVLLDSSAKINWIALQSDDAKYTLFGVKPGMGWAESHKTITGYAGWNWKPVNNSPSDNMFVNSIYADRKIMLSKNPLGNVGNVIYGIWN